MAKFQPSGEFWDYVLLVIEKSVKAEIREWFRGREFDKFIAEREDACKAVFVRFSRLIARVTIRVLRIVFTVRTEPINFNIMISLILYFRKASPMVIVRAFKAVESLLSTFNGYEANSTVEVVTARFL